MQKQCYDCGEVRPLTEFHKNKARRDGYSDKCKRCSKAYHRNHYEANKAAYVGRAAEQKAAMREFINGLKQGPCTDCKLSFHPCVMDFDHIGTNKTMMVSALARFNNKAKVLAEIAKCELVCANCHRLRTYRRAEEAQLVERRPSKP